MADSRTARNRAANLAALAGSQPRLAKEIGTAEVPLVPVFGRDGFLTACDAGGRWWGGCSLPHRAARAGLKGLEVHGAVACFLAPPHAAHVRVALDATEPHQAIVAVLPDPQDLWVMLGCEDFSGDVASHRLWFAWGEAWAREMGRLFEERTGLPTPTQFIRLPAAEAEFIDPLVDAGQKVFSDVLAGRALRLRAMREGRVRVNRPVRRVCVRTGSRFRVWDDAGLVLSEVVADGMAGDAEWVPVCPDDPLSASPLALASAAAGCDAIVAADFSRSDAPDLLPDALPWVTWVTKPDKLPAPVAGAHDDVLLVTDGRWRERAVRLGWPAERVAVAGWPTLAGDGEGGNLLSLISDTRRADLPPQVEDFSSHRLLWQTIRQEIEADPFTVGEDAAGYLEARVRRYGVADEELDRGLFIEGLILPAYVQAVARPLLLETFPLRLYGNGWLQLEEFAPHAGGPVTSRAGLRRAIADSAAVVHAWPLPYTHPAESAGRPVVRSAGCGQVGFLREVRRALAGGGGTVDTGPILSSELLLRQLPAA